MLYSSALIFQEICTSIQDRTHELNVPICTLALMWNFTAYQIFDVEKSWPIIRKPNRDAHKRSILALSDLFSTASVLLETLLYTETQNMDGNIISRSVKKSDYSLIKSIIDKAYIALERWRKGSQETNRPFAPCWSTANPYSRLLDRENIASVQQEGEAVAICNHFSSTDNTTSSPKSEPNRLAARSGFPQHHLFTLM